MSDASGEGSEEARRALTQLIERAQTEIAPRMIVRWIDESRPVPAVEGSGITVARVLRTTITVKLEGEAVQQSFEGISREEVARAVGTRPIDVHYISDNLNR